MPHIVAALSQGYSVVVRSIESYHRGPIGMAAICKKVFDFDVKQVLQFIASQRNVHPPYAANGPILPSSLGSAATWASRLRPLPLPDSVGAFAPAAAGRRSSASASSQGMPSPVPMTLAQKEKRLQKDTGKYLYRAMAANRSDVTQRHPASSQDLSGFDLSGFDLAGAIFVRSLCALHALLVQFCAGPHVAHALQESSR